MPVKVYSTRLRPSTLSLSPFTAEDMSYVGSSWLAHALARIRSGKNTSDAPAKPLNPYYAKQKVKGRRVVASGGTMFKGKDIRDWTLRGWTLASAKVKVASQESVTIGFITAQSNAIVSGLRRAAGFGGLGDMWGADCKSDADARHAAFITVLHRRIMQDMRDSNQYGLTVRSNSQTGAEFL